MVCVSEIKNWMQIHSCIRMFFLEYTYLIYCGTNHRENWIENSINFDNKNNVLIPNKELTTFSMKCGILWLVVIDYPSNCRKWYTLSHWKNSLISSLIAQILKTFLFESKCKMRITLNERRWHLSNNIPSVRHFTVYTSPNEDTLNEYCSRKWASKQKCNMKSVWTNLLM